MKWFRAAAMLMLVMGFSGCTHALARQMVTAPNRRLGNGPEAGRVVKDSKTERRLSIPVGPPQAEVAVWVKEPKSFPGVPVRGTILVLHGFLSDHNVVRDAADAFVEAGYRAVLVDLRGHGESTGRFITYGVVESRDMVQVLNFLQAHDLAEKTVGVYGTSLGASVAIQFAAIDPRVASVVAVAPFATLKGEAPHFGRLLLPFPGLFISDAEYGVMVEDAGKIAQFDPEQASSLAAITHTKARILLIHGEIDAIIPAESSRLLHAAAPLSELLILPLYGHLAACLDLTGQVPRLACKFFERPVVPPVAP